MSVGSLKNLGFIKLPLTVTLFPRLSLALKKNFVGENLFGAREVFLKLSRG